MSGEKVSIKTLQEKKRKNEKITMLTAYDYPTAKLVDKSGIDSILVGDSVSNNILGMENTLTVSMDEMVHHTKAVKRGVENALLIADMPFLSYQASEEEAVKNAGRFLQEAGAESVKIEGGEKSLSQIKKIIDAGIPVMGHLGLTPQRIHQFGGYGLRGKSRKEAMKIYEDAMKLEEAGVFSLVLESVPSQVSKTITDELEIPTIGIGAGPHCDGQVLVINDILGMSEISPKFAKEYVDLESKIKDAIVNFRKEVESGEFPAKSHSYEMKKEEKKQLEELKRNRSN
ncbi:MAG: 3-methyl-2-oxobutanoate hydroxymethyltransferase [Candidatus Hadarchaeia archaeon]